MIERRGDHTAGADPAVDRQRAIARHAERNQSEVAELRRRAVLCALADVTCRAIALLFVVEDFQPVQFRFVQFRLARKKCIELAGVRIELFRRLLEGFERTAGWRRRRCRRCRKSRAPNASRNSSAYGAAFTAATTWPACCPSQTTTSAESAPGPHHDRRGRPRSNRRSDPRRRFRRLRRLTRGNAA